MKNNPNHVCKKNWILTILLFVTLVVQAQTVVTVKVNQPQKLKIIATELFSETADKIVLGNEVSIDGGIEPYQYVWLNGNQQLGTSLVLEIPKSTPTNAIILNVKDANNCTCWENISLTNVSEPFVDSTGIIIYPNPVIDQLHINPQGYLGKLNVSVFDSKGIFMLREQVVGEATIHFDLSPGLYFIKIETPNNQIVAFKKIMVS